MVVLAVSLTLVAAVSAPSPLAQTPTETGVDTPHALRDRAPATTVLWVETNALHPLLQDGFEHPLLKAALQDPGIAGALKESGTDPFVAAKAFEALVGQSPFEFANALASGGLAIGLLDPAPTHPQPFLMLRGNDPSVMEEALENLEGVLESLGAVRTPSALDRRRLGSTARKSWRLGSAGAAWTHAGTLVVAADWETLAVCCGVKDRSKDLAAARSELMASPGQPFTPGSFAWFNLDALHQRSALEDLRAIADQPGAHFVLGPALTYLGRAKTLAVGLELNGEEIHLRTLGGSVEVGAGTGSFPTKNAEAWTHQTGPHVVAFGTIHRDIGFLLSRRTELFPPRAQPAIAEGLSNLALVTGGPDALDELLAAIAPTIGLQSHTVTFPEDVTPDVPLPSLALKLTVADPAKNGTRLTSAFQSAVSLANVEQAQQGRDGLRLALESVEGTTVTTAKLLPPAAGASVDLRYNFEPACAVVNDAFLFGTRSEVVVAAVRRVQQSTNTLATSPVAPAAQQSPWITVDKFRVSGAPIAALIDSQLDLLVMDAVLSKGKGRQQAEAEANLVLRLAQQILGADYHTQWRSDADSKLAILADLTLQLAR